MKNKFLTNCLIASCLTAVIPNTSFAGQAPLVQINQDVQLEPAGLAASLQNVQLKKVESVKKSQYSVNTRDGLLGAITNFNLNNLNHVEQNEHVEQNDDKEPCAFKEMRNAVNAVAQKMSAFIIEEKEEEEDEWGEEEAKYELEKEKALEKRKLQDAQALNEAKALDDAKERAKAQARAENKVLIETKVLAQIQTENQQLEDPLAKQRKQELGEILNARLRVQREANVDEDEVANIEVKEAKENKARVPGDFAAIHALLKHDVSDDEANNANVTQGDLADQTQLAGNIPLAPPLPGQYIGNSVNNDIAATNIAAQLGADGLPLPPVPFDNNDAVQIDIPADIQPPAPLNANPAADNANADVGQGAQGAQAQLAEQAVIANNNANANDIILYREQKADNNLQVVKSEENLHKFAGENHHNDTETKAEEDKILATDQKDLKNDSLDRPENLIVILQNKSTENLSLDGMASDEAQIVNISSDQQALTYLQHEAQLKPEDRTENNKKLASKISGFAKMKSAIASMSDRIASNITNRLSYLAFLLRSGIAAGDNTSQEISLWTKGLYGVTNQKQDGTATGYKGKLSGGMIGLDVEMKDSFILGAAYSNISSAFKYKTSHGKAIVSSNALTAYSQANISENVLWKNIASYIVSNVTTRFARESSLTATGKFKNKTFNFKTELGYKIPKNYFVIIPNIALKYNLSKDGKHMESGAEIYNIPREARSNHSIDASIGASLMTTYVTNDDTDITPTLNASVELNLSDKSQKVRAKFAWMDNYLDNTLENGKSAKMSYNIGAGVTAKKGNIEISTDYNCTLKKGYTSHQGSIKFKVMF